MRVTRRSKHNLPHFQCDGNKPLKKRECVMCRSLLRRLGEYLPQPRLRFTVESARNTQNKHIKNPRRASDRATERPYTLAHDLRPVDHRHVNADLIGYGSTNHGLPGAGGPVQKHPAGRLDPCGVKNKTSSRLDAFFVFYSSF